ncbi:MAG: transporter [Bacteroidaceae bacterium]|nr:transporter [Bacteroidaceae bacterium]
MNSNNDLQCSRKQSRSAGCQSSSYKGKRDFTLPISITIGTLIYLVFRYIPQFDGAGDALYPAIIAIVPFFMALILFVTFLKLQVRDVRIRLWHVFILFAQIVLSLLCVGAIVFFRLEGGMKVLFEGMLICVICPSAIAASVVSSKLGGNITEMTLFTLLSNIAAVFTMPLLFPLVESSADQTFLQSALIVFDKTVKILMLPLAASFFVKRFVPRLYNAVVSVKDLNYYLWAILLAVVTGITVRNIFNAHIAGVFLIATALSAAFVTALQFWLGRYIGGFCGDRIDAGQGLGQKNTTFAIWCAITYLNPLSSIAPGCYILTQNIFNSWQIYRHEREKM